MYLRLLLFRLSLMNLMSLKLQIHLMSQISRLYLILHRFRLNLLYLKIQLYLKLLILLMYLLNL